MEEGILIWNVSMLFNEIKSCEKQESKWKLNALSYESYEEPRRRREKKREEEKKRRREEE